MEARARSETNPQVKQLFLFISRQHSGMAAELRRAYDEVPSAEDDSLDGKTVIGICLEWERMDTLTEDLKELEHRDRYPDVWNAPGDLNRG
jgi:hypothetical protein